MLQKICYNFIVMKVFFENNNTVLRNVEDFNLHHIFDCGQCFRWNVCPDGSYEGVAKGHGLKILQQGDTVTLYNTDNEVFYNIWYDYFDFSKDYGKIKEILSEDEVLKKAIPFGSGIRILKQELFETVISFIISASNNIPRIKKIVESLCENFGRKITYMGKTFYTFPDCNTLSKLSLEDLAVIRAGFRDKYIKAAADAFAAKEISDDTFLGLSTPEAKKVLQGLYGVGSKVADCILLFGLSRTDSFPVDVWVKRIMETLYLGKETKNVEIERFALSRFGEYSGLAQQYLFFYGRENLR